MRKQVETHEQIKMIYSYDNIIPMVIEASTLLLHIDKCYTIKQCK